MMEKTARRMERRSRISMKEMYLIQRFKLNVPVGSNEPSDGQKLYRVEQCRKSSGYLRMKNIMETLSIIHRKEDFNVALKLVLEESGLIGNKHAKFYLEERKLESMSDDDVKRLMLVESL